MTVTWRRLAVSGALGSGAGEGIGAVRSPIASKSRFRLSSIAISLAALALGVSSNSANAVPDKVQYELQERCAKRAEQIFAKDWPHGSPDNSVGYTQRASYISHYNASLNKCFILETTEAYDPKGPGIIKILLDVNSNKEYGMFSGHLPGSTASRFPPTCNFGDNICRTEAEWDAMANVYMEEDGTGNTPPQTQK
jgi:hypothetical protein